MTPLPPHRVERLLAWALPRAAQGDILGDLREDYALRVSRSGRIRARCWFVAQAIVLGIPFATRRIMRALMHGLATDVRDGWRGVLRRPALSVLMVGSLGLGLGLATSVFTVVNGLLYVPLPYTAPTQLVEIDELHPTEVCQGCSVGAPVTGVPVWRSARTLRATEALDTRTSVALVDEVPTRVAVAAVTPGLIDLLGLRPAAGQLSLRDPGNNDTVLVGYGFWQTWFGGQSAVVGRTITLDGRVRTIAGVVSRDTPLPARADVIEGFDIRSPAVDLTSRVQAIARLAPDVSIDQAAAELAVLQDSIESGRRAADGWRERVRPLRSSLMDDLDNPSLSWLALGGAILVLLAAGLNVCSILIAQLAGRTEELGVRRALGADRRRLVRLVMAEVAWLTLGGITSAIILALLSRSAIVAALGGTLPPWVTFPIDVRVLLTVVTLGALVTVLVGLGPALTSCGAVERRLSAHLQSTRASRRHRRLRLLVAAQVALGVVLVAGTADVICSARTIRDFSTLKYRVSGITTVATLLPDDGAQARTGRLLDGLQILPDVRLASLEQRLFLGSWGGPGTPSALRLDGATEGVPDTVVPRHSLAVGPRWFELMEVPILRGRPIDSRDCFGAAGAAVVSESVAATLWPGDDALGKVVHLNDWPTPLSVVGIAADVVGNPSSESRRILPRLYASIAQAPSATSVTWLIDSRSGNIRPDVWAERIHGIDADALVTEVSTVEAGLRRWTASAAGIAWVLSSAGLVALGLVALGIHGTLSFQVASTRRELGIRRALGAHPIALAGTTLRGLLLSIGAAVLAGAAAAWTLGRLLGTSGLGSESPGSLLVAGGVLTASALVASTIALRRALTVTPLSALRDE